MSEKRNSRDEINKVLIKNSLRELLFYSPGIIGFMAMAISITLAFFIIGLPGLFMIIKKESPSGPFTIRGIPAIIIGVIWLIIFWGIGVIFFFVEFLGYRF